MTASRKINQQLPFGERSEIAVLGTLSCQNEAWELAKGLTEDDFLIDSHKRIFACIRSRLSIGRPIDLILMMDAMKRQKELDAIGGAAYLAFLAEGIPRNFDITSHVVLLKEKAELRRILRVCNDAMVQAYCEEPSTDILAALRQWLGL